MTRISIAAALLAAAIAVPAAAQEQAPFTGPHVEAIAGYDHLGDNQANGRDGVLYGIGAGYDFQLGGAIVGIEGEVTDSTQRANGSNLINPNDTSRLETDRDLYIGARVGFAVAPSTMLYAKGGYSNARLKGTYFNGLSTTTNGRFDLEGYRVGAGVEQKFALFGPSGFVKAEYRYSNYRGADFGGGTNFRIDSDRHQVVAGLGIRF